MQTVLKIPRDLFAQAQADLHRPHAHAAERVGFFSTRCTRQASTTLVHCVAYSPVADGDYLPDDTVGVRIGPRVITEAMSRAVRDGVGQLHVHAHDGHGLPRPSRTDLAELPPLAASLRNANPDQVHGWMILGESDAWTTLSTGVLGAAVDGGAVALVGFPTVAHRRFHGPLPKGRLAKLRERMRRGQGTERYDRQSFLGPDSAPIIATAVVGVVGLGGGGSHVIQQLAHLGFRNYVLCDDDRISATNLNRLVGATSDDVRAKRPKTDIAQRVIRNLHAGANVVAADQRWEQTLDQLCNCDVIVGCVDTFLARRDLEAFCRRNLIPYVDVGMDVHRLESGKHEIYGQVILSMPGHACMHCMGFLNEKVLAEEAALYGAAGSRPQVVWSNGLLCSAATGIVVDLFTDWSGTLRGPVFQSFRGSSLTLQPDNRLAVLTHSPCLHHALTDAGDASTRPL